MTCGTKVSPFVRRMRHSDHAVQGVEEFLKAQDAFLRWEAAMRQWERDTRADPHGLRRRADAVLQQNAQLAKLHAEWIAAMRICANALSQDDHS